MMFAAPQGLSSLVKEGSRHMRGPDESTLRNIAACEKLSQITRTSLGPNSMNKLLINHLDKHFVTSDAATMLKELEVQHPAAKLVVMAAKMQDEECGDATNLTATLAGELLSHAGGLIREGIHLHDIIRGYQFSAQKAIDIMKELTCWKVENIEDVEQLKKGVTSVLGSKQLQCADHIASLIVKAAVKALPVSASADFNVDNVRVCKLPGASLYKSFVVQGMVHGREPVGTVRVKDAPGGVKVAVFTCGIEFTSTETKGTVLLHNAEELLNFTTKEEEKMDETIKAIKATGVEVIISGASISDIALHYCNKYEILVIKVNSKFEQRRLCRSLKAIALARLGAPQPDEIGIADFVRAEEIGGSVVTLIQAPESRVSTIVLRGATSNLLDEAERAIDDAVQCVKGIAKDPRFVPGGGATEIEIARQLRDIGAAQPGIEQFAIQRFGETLEIVPRTLAENSGLKHTEALAKLYADHQAGQTTSGIDVTSCDGTSPNPSFTCDVVARGILDHLETKINAFRLAVDAVLTILKVDEIIMQKPAGGPNPDAAPRPDDD